MVSQYVFFLCKKGRIEFPAIIDAFQLMKQFNAFILPDYDYRSRLVKKVARRILVSNSDMLEVKEFDWKVFVINLPIPNAMVLPVMLNNGISRLL